MQRTSKTNTGMQFSLLVAIPCSKLKGVCLIFETIAKKMKNKNVNDIKIEYK